MAAKALMIVLCCVGLLAGFCGSAQGQGPQSPSPVLEKGTGETTPAPVVAMVYNRPIVTFRSTVLGRSPRQRARRTEDFIDRLIESDRIGAVSSRPTSEGNLILVGKIAVFLISPKDLDPVTGETMEQVTQRVTKNLTLALAEARSLPILLRDAGYTALATVGFLAFLWVLLRGHFWFRNRLEALERRHLGKFRLEGITMLDTEQVIRFTGFLVRILKSGPVSWALALYLIPAALAFGQTPNKPTTAPAKKPYTLVDLTRQKFTGDLDGMIERRLIRILVTYSKTHYFVDRGTQRGLTYEFGRRFEDSLNKKLKKKRVRVHVVFVPVARDELIPALLEGRGDVAAANLTITPARLKRVDFTDPWYRDASEIVVTGPGAEPISTVDDLSGKEVYVGKSSSFYESLEKVNADLAKRRKAPVKIRPAPEELEIEDILEMVNAGLVKVTIADNYMAEFWKQILPKIVLHPEVAVRTGGEIAQMIRKNSPQLKAELNQFIARYPEGSKTRNVVVQKYFKNTKFAKSATSKEEFAKFEAVVKFFRKYGDKYELDYLLMMAQGYQESKLDQKARSPSGAIGVMQVLPSTGKEMRAGDITKLEPNIHAGVKYVRFMMDQFYAKEPMDPLNKGLFTFAAYNAGPGRISKLRKEAARRGLDPNKWFNNVEVVAAEKIGRETVQYVSNIYKYYLAYKMVAEQSEERQKARKEVKKEGSK
jgi:membrane-bound lytic murein transglycosylase MltF